VAYPTTAARRDAIGLFAQAVLRKVFTGWEGMTSSPSQKRRRIHQATFEPLLVDTPLELEGLALPHIALKYLAIVPHCLHGFDNEIGGQAELLAKVALDAEETA
jgi:hypothetical protein